MDAKAPISERRADLPGVEHSAISRHDTHAGEEDDHHDAPV
jgi:hypothetical protein